MLTQIAAHVMGWPQDKINLVTRDSEVTPDSGVSAGSRQTYVTGHALIKAIEKLKQVMKETGALTRQDLVKAGKPTRVLARSGIALTGMDENGQGDPWESRVHGVQLAEVAVNTETGEVRIVKMTAVVDAGVVLNPLAVIGQIEGGMDMGAGWALREQYVLGQSKDWRTTKFPTMQTAFDMQTILLESPRKNGPLGATGVGEFTLIPTAPAITNAIYDAVAVRIRELPATPDKILSGLAGLKKE
jgi:aldehyde oxidoreductase